MIVLCVLSGCAALFARALTNINVRDLITKVGSAGPAAPAAAAAAAPAADTKKEEKKEAKKEEKKEEEEEEDEDMGFGRFPLMYTFTRDMFHALVKAIEIQVITNY